MECVYYTSMSLMFLFLSLSLMKRTATYENLSLRPQTTIRLSSVYLEQYGSYAKDNNTSKDIKTCSHTDVGKAHASLTVDLEKQFRINAIKIFYRDQQIGEGTNRFDNFYLQVSQDMKEFQLCYNDTKPGLPPDEVDIPCEQTARYVVVNSSYDSPNDRNNGAMLEICEIQVMGCELNTYGPNCELCGRCHNCDPRNGCSKDCIHGYYGDRCTTKCSPGCKDSDCFPIDGDCKYGCKSEELIGRNCSECIDGYYRIYSYEYDSLNCEQCKGECRAGTTCNKYTGGCDDGCAPGLRGRMCNMIMTNTEGKACHRGYFGQNCSSRCYGCKDSVCDAVSGHCTVGCRETSLIGTTCSKCTAGYYLGRKWDTGQYVYYCSECSNCLTKTACDGLSGSCLDGCLAGWRGDTCRDRCGSGTYGVNCSKSCSRNCAGGKCNHITGDCDNQLCKGNWTGRKCEECKSGYYRADDTCIACSENCEKRSCNKSSGRCFFGCVSGWKGAMCQESCPFGVYGKNCLLRCRGKCYNNMTCSQFNGTCSSCLAGYRGKYCDKECSAGSYGLECSSKCSNNCKNSQECAHDTGQCSNGCTPGWQPPYCIKGCKNHFYGLNCALKCSKHCLNNTVCNHINGTCPKGCETGYEGHNCNQETILLPNTSEKNLSVIIVVILGLLILIAAILAIVIFSRLRERKPETTRVCTYAKEDAVITNRHENLNVISTEFEDQDWRLTINDIGEYMYYNEMHITKDISITELPPLIKSMAKSESAEFKSEFQRLPEGERFNCSVGKLKENVQKNRFKTTFPYDHSRVVLKANGLYTSDYINASYIEDMDGKRCYIASQGPRKNTVLDHWRMIWQEKICKIIMLTNLIEGDKVKCEKYWPEENEDMIQGQLIIKLIETKTYAYYVIRKLHVQDQTNKDTRTIYHLHYSGWPDHGTPDPIQLVKFYRHMTSIEKTIGNALLLVHCSAGIGRTGSFIALDALYRYGTMTGKINVSEYVKLMRKDRMMMVQTSGQYEFLYHALCEAFRTKDHILTREQFLRRIENIKSNKSANSLYKDEYNELQSLRVLYDDQDYISGKENIHLNLTKHVLPLEEYRVYLPFQDIRGDYYNAVVLSSFMRKDELISGQFPIPGAGIDLLRLLVDQEITFLVLNNPMSTIEAILEWSVPEAHVVVDDYELIADSSDILPENIKTTLLRIRPLESDSFQTTQCFEPIRSEIDERNGSVTEPVVALLRYINIRKLSNPEGRIATLSKDGAKGSGLFLAVYNACQQLYLDDSVDMFSIVRELQIRRPEMIVSADEYELCFQTLYQYMCSDSVYCNT